jgi:hypothetical protein
MGKNRTAGQRRKNLVGYDALHAAALPGGEEDSGSAAHGKG